MGFNLVGMRLWQHWSSPRKDPTSHRTYTFHLGGAHQKFHTAHRDPSVFQLVYFWRWCIQRIHNKALPAFGHDVLYLRHLPRLSRSFSSSGVQIFFHASNQGNLSRGDEEEFRSSFSQSGEVFVSQLIISIINIWGKAQANHAQPWPL